MNNHSTWRHVYSASGVCQLPCGREQTVMRSEKGLTHRNWLWGDDGIKKRETEVKKIQPDHTCERVHAIWGGGNSVHYE